LLHHKALTNEHFVTSGYQCAPGSYRLLVQTHQLFFLLSQV